MSFVTRDIDYINPDFLLENGLFSFEQYMDSIEEGILPTPIQPHLIPIDTKQLKPHERLACMNTHPTNIGISTAQVGSFWTVINKLFGSSFLSALKWGFALPILMNIPAIAEQVFARDFMTWNSKSPNFEWSDDFEGLKIRAINDGEVVVADKMRGPYGNVIMIKHDSGEYSVYAHLKTKGILVSKGQKVKRGQKIGLAGNTGNSSAPHLHFEMTLNNPDSSLLTIGKPLTNFVKHKVVRFGWNELYLCLDENKLMSLLKERMNKWENNNTGNIESFCFIKD